MRNCINAVVSLTACLALGTLGATGAHAQVTFTGTGSSSQITSGGGAVAASGLGTQVVNVPNVPAPVVPEPGVVVSALSLTSLLGMGMVRGRRRSSGASKTSR